MDETDDGFDLIEPSLIQQLKKILDQYPDDDQILKELTQNAEDAKASQLKFLYDKKRYKATYLYDEELAQFQGPALYAYNDAKFTQEDWRGIRLVSDSIKVEDPLKVGRFGLGFKSVFHFTDLPSIVSDTRLGIIDPHGVYFSDKRHRRTGKHWQLKDVCKEVKRIPDQFLPYKGVFGCSDDVFSQGYYNGTLFRFPLRAKPSKLSETLYSAEKMYTLFESFKANAHMMLLFLQHVESIELYVREESEAHPRRIFQVKLAEKCLQTVRTRRKQFYEKIKPGRVMPASITVTYPITIETVNLDFPSANTTKQYSFLVSNHFCGGQVSSMFKTLMTDHDLSYIPAVSVAMVLPSNPSAQAPEIQGHVFCTLPLPVQKTSLTGLPVHVNGFFALSQNRRYIKTPNAEQENEQRSGRQLTDKSLLWNKCLMEEAIPRAYATMLMEAVNGSSLIIPVPVIYKAWPDVSSIDQKWKGLEKPLFQLLLKEKVVHTQAQGGKWVTVKEAIFQRLLGDEPKDLLLRVLLSVNLPAVSVPSHILRAIDIYSPNQAEVTPRLIRRVLKQAPYSYRSLHRRDKLLLLQFTLRDGDFNDLHGLQLLPLSSGKFVIFERGARPVYIPSPKHPQELLPGLEDQFLDRNVHEDILEKLQIVASTGHMQLEFLRKESVASLLWHSFPPNWKNGERVSWYPGATNQKHPPRDWIKLVWNYLGEFFTTAEEIQSLGPLPLIPLNISQTPVILTRLRRPSKVVVKRLNDTGLDDTLMNILRKLGVIVLSDLPTFISMHPAVLEAFVNPPSVRGVFEAMMVSSSKMEAGKFVDIVRKEVPTKEKHVLRSFLSHLQQQIPGTVAYNLLCSLPIFETVNKTFVSKQDCMYAAPLQPLPIPLLREAIDVVNVDSRRLALLLNVKILTPTELLCRLVFSDLQQGKYSEEDVDKIMLYVFEHFAHVIRTDADFKRNLQMLPFVPKRNMRVRAPDLFDPRNDTLRKIFGKENVFPVGMLYNKRPVLEILEDLGMKTESSITSKDLYQSAKLVVKVSHLPTARQKSNAIFHYLADHPSTLQEPISGQTLGALLRDIHWLSRLRQRTPNFPPSLPWWEQAGHFFKPTEVTSHEFANLVGTVKPCVEVDSTSQIAKYFGWHNKPSLNDVVKHLDRVVCCYSKDEKPYYMVVVNEIYSFLSGEDHAAVNEALGGVGISDWVWNGDGFSSPHHLLSSKPPIDLTPYVLSLPSEMMKHSQLFYRFGLRKESDPAVLLQAQNMIKNKYDNEHVQYSAFEVKHDLQLSVDILNELANKELSADLQAKILLPTHIEDNAYVRLEPVEHCMYCEHEWLKIEVEDKDMEYLYVHPNVPNSTAERLGVPTLTNRMLDPDELFIGEEFGQEEKLTTRLNRLLEEYTDGSAVLKELVQNADDAGSTEVRFLYDERTNEDAMTGLIDEGMRNCQGPALWVYNDAEFKDEDFVNITKLNEATKVYDTEKIGKFGLGFNAVYNLTDVPMFISKNHFAIFDPHTSFLGNAIKNRGKPGIKIDLNKDVKRLRTFANQFKPFNGIFGCDLHFVKKDNSLDGTLFRFPLRTREQAIASEIKKLHYSDHEMRELLQMFLDRAPTLLLFTQNVLRVGIYSLRKSSSSDPQPSLMFQVTKSLSQGGIFRELSVPITLPFTTEKLNAEQQSLLKQCNFLQASSKVARSARCNKVDPSEFPESSIAVDIDCSFTTSGLNFFKVRERLRQECATWLVVSSMGNGQAMQLAKNDPSLLPSAGVAVQLVPTESNAFLPSPVVMNVSGTNLDGAVFCYLPLPIYSGLPVHINGAFSLAANRRHLQKKLEDDKTCPGVKWNKELMQDSILSAYFSLLEDVKSVAPDDGSYIFHSLWPTVDKVHEDFLAIVTSFYKQLASRCHALFSNGRNWVGITDVVFLHPDLRQNPEVGDAAFAVLQRFPPENTVVVDLPDNVFQSFCSCGLWDVIHNRTYTKRHFLCDVFFPNIFNTPSALRDVLVLDVMNHSSMIFDDLLKMHACIPTSPYGRLMHPGQLVHPDRDASSLFWREDGRFPCGTEDTFLHPLRLAKLMQLGMASDDLPWEEIAERAESIQRINEVDCKGALKRAKALLEFLESKMKRKDKDPSQRILSRLQKARFLPVLRKPKSFPLAWKGEEFHGSRSLLVAPRDVFLKEEKHLVCCTEPLAAPDISKNVSDLLKLRGKKVTTDHVMFQLKDAISCNIGSLDREGYEELSRVCKKVYSFLQNNITGCGSSIKECLHERRFILVDKCFLPAHCVSLEIKADCSPYLYKLPEDLFDAYPRLMKLAGVRERFEGEDYISCLREVKEKFHEKKLDKQTLEVAVNMAIQLAETLERSDENLSKLQSEWGSVYLPDSTGVMRSLPDLCIKDCPWMPDEPGVKFVNDKISWATCVQLGVKTRREEALQAHAMGIPFGQQEKLTNRLKRILTGYPSEKELLKELLQNADDSQATEICFIKDPRHHPDEKVFQDTWKALQGPALCVFNNRPFTKADIRGVQSLGEGSKGDDINKTGQYGVGFNAVYHLTDVPSFMSKGEEIGHVLCVFDPHCKYVPNASDKEPGRMFQDIRNLKKKFPDVFPCYLEDHFRMKDATMFRFPLKTEKMAKESKISPTLVTVEKLDEMLKDMKKELFEVLLFMNNVKKISLCTVDESGKLVDTYSLEVIMSKEDDKKRQTFARCVKAIANQVKEEDDFLPTSIEVNKCTYTMNVRDCSGKEEKWLIVQQVGFEKPVQTSIIDAYKNQQLGMLPRGGVACLLKSNESEKQMQGKKKAYCFLPLPVETDLPVHVNGHFALDHEARRNLWRDETGGYRSDWNNALLSDVIASCYLTLLDEVRGFIQLPVMHDATPCLLSCSERTILHRLSVYEKLFPTFPIEDPHWMTLIYSVYKEMSRKRMRLIPSVRRVKASSSGGTKDSEGCERVQVMWFPLEGIGKERTYFNNLEVKGCFAQQKESKEDEKKRMRKELRRIIDKVKFEETLLQTGLNLVALSTTIFDSLLQAGVEVNCISPSVVMDFYKSFSDADPLCDVGKIPCPVDKTPFKDKEGVLRVLKYCKDDEHFQKNLSGLPLLLTQDKYLHAFSESDPRCLSRYVNILPSSPSIFVHSEVQKDVFPNGCRDISVFRPLDVDLFASHLHQNVPRELVSEGRNVKWCPHDASGSGFALPNPHWISTVWNFLRQVVTVKLKKSEANEDSGESQQIRQLLSPLSTLCILPATVQLEGFQTSRCWERATDHFLVPLNMAESVLDFTDCGLSSPKLVQVLRMLGLPELDAVPVMDKSLGESKALETYHFTRTLVATLKAPNSVLLALQSKLQTDPLSLGGKLKSSDATVVLQYFSCNIDSLTDDHKHTLKKLPFFQRACGGLAKLDDRKGFILPIEVPKDEMGVVEVRLGCMFLESQEGLSDLYKSLKIARLSRSEVYVKLILKCFQHLSLKGKLAHLQYLRDFISSPSADEMQNNEKKTLLNVLRTVQFIPSKNDTVERGSSSYDPRNASFRFKNGTFLTASSFYDPRNSVFRHLLSKDKFPPEPFSSKEWLPFLRKLGLVQDVSREDVLRFAAQVAHEAATAQTKDTNKKSEVLVCHLLSRANVIHEDLFRCVCDIPFVAPHQVSNELQELCPPFKKGQSPFVTFKGAVVNKHEEIVWTRAPLLPMWANPRKYLENENSLAHLQVVEKPSVDLVVGHFQTIRSRFESNNKKREDMCTTLKKVMEHIYTFLQKAAIGNSEAKKVLQTTRCVLVEEGGKFILPSQAVLELYEDLEIKPFLYRVPPEFGKFQHLFEFLGCSKSVTPTHYAMVLDMLHKNCQNSKLHPDKVIMCSKAVKGFFESLQENPLGASTLCQLYLPAVPPERSSSGDHSVTLRQSNELMFNDVPAYRDRIQELNQPFVRDLGLMDVSCRSAMVNYKDLMMKLPSALQPRMLSLVVKEKLSNPQGAVIVRNEAVDEMKELLSSVQFGRGVVRTVRDVNSHQIDFNEEVIANIERGLRSIELYAVESLKTSLLLNDDVIPGSEAELPYFQVKQEVSGDETWKVFVNSGTGADETASSIPSLLSKVIVEMYGEFLGIKAFLIPEMLRCLPEEIWPLLDRMGIREDDTYNPAEMDMHPEPGSFIPIADHHLLNDAFEEFKPGEYVGYQLEDPNLHLKEGVPTYIYAKIIEEVTDEDTILLTKMYRINIGQEQVVVNAANLHNFHRLKGISEQKKQCQTNRQQVFNEIMMVLKEAWSLPEETRRQIVKRLYLQWHPDKNLGSKEFCSEVFQLIQSTVSRLDGSYSDCFASWGARAKKHGCQRQEYGESFSQQYGSSESPMDHTSSQNVPPSFCKRNPQPGEATRWFRQAEADLAAGENEIHFSSPSYEWACFKCHQAAEKALKAAQYMIDANKMNIHNLVQNCHGLDDSELVQLARQLEVLLGDSTRMRYPDRMCYPQIPNDVYSAEMATEALGIAKKVVEGVRSKLT